MSDYRHVHDNLKKAPSRIIRYWPQVLSILSNIIAIGGLLAAILLMNQSTKELFLIVELVILFMLLLSFLIWQEYRYSRRARYAEALYNIHSGVHFLRDYFSEINQLSELDCKNKLSNVVTVFAHAFSIVTGTHCRGSIEILSLGVISEDDFEKITDKNERVKYLQAITFCRDEISSLCMSETILDECVHPLAGNSDFHELFLDHTKRYYLCNDTTSGNYQSTAGQRTTGNLNYKSILVLPIRRCMYEQDKVNHTKAKYGGNEGHDIIGYLCIDSMRRNVFNKEHDVEMGAIIADSLFTFIKCYHDKTKKNEAKSRNEEVVK